MHNQTLDSKLSKPKTWKMDYIDIPDLLPEYVKTPCNLPDSA